MTKRMNEIKRSPEKYYYHHCIHSLADTALDMAITNLFHKVNNGNNDTVSIDESTLESGVFEIPSGLCGHSG